MCRLYQSLFASAAMAVLTFPAYADYNLTILHTNDVHSRIEEVNKADVTCSPKDSAAGECFGGVARLKTAIDTERAKAENVLVLDAGDQFQGSLFFTTYQGVDNAEFMNAIGYDAMALGNHEFDRGQEGLAPFLDKITLPVLAANIETATTSPIYGKYRPYFLKTVGTEKIGIIGLITPDTVEIARPGQDIRFLDPKTTLENIIRELKTQGATKIIALTHLGYEIDKKLAAEVEGVDVIVGGHSHTLLRDDDPKAFGPYPTLIKSPSGKEVPVVTAYAYTQYLGKLVLDFDDNGTLKSANGAPIRLDNSITPDPVIAARVAEMAKPIEGLKNRKIAEVTTLIDGSGTTCRSQQCPMGDLVATAILDRVREQGMTASIINGGALRASIKEGDVSMGDVLVVLPFQNTVATFQLKGSDLRSSLENGVSQIETGGGRYPQVAGMRFTVDKSKEPGTRITSVDMQDDKGNWQSLDDNKLYGIASTNYLRRGGDGYAAIADKAEKAYDSGPSLDQVLADYLQEHTPYRTTQTNLEKPSETVAPVATPLVTSVVSGQTYLVKAGDSYWKIAETIYGDGAKWRVLFHKNPQYQPRKLPVGASLKIGTNL